MSKNIRFIPSGRGKAQCPPNPAFPDGVAVGCAREGQNACTVALPYPAPECGIWVVECQQCGVSVAVTAAGRPDDPISVTVECKGGRSCQTN